MSEWLRRRVLRWLFPERGGNLASFNSQLRQAMIELGANR